MAKKNTIIQRGNSEKVVSIPVKCVECIHAKPRDDFQDYKGEPILYRCRYSNYSFGEWRIIEDCPHYQKREIQKRTNNGTRI